MYYSTYALIFPQKMKNIFILERIQPGIENIGYKIIALGGQALAITDETGATETKRLTLAKDPHDWVSNQAERESAVIMSKDGKNIVHLNFRKSTPFVDGKVNLIAFTDVVHVENGSDWVSDNRFLVRPDS